MTHLTLIAAETDDAYYEHEHLKQLKAEAAELAARERDRKKDEQRRTRAAKILHST